MKHKTLDTINYLIDCRIDYIVGYSYKYYMFFEWNVV